MQLMWLNTFAGRVVRVGRPDQGPDQADPEVDQGMIALNRVDHYQRKEVLRGATVVNHIPGNYFCFASVT